jgi:hypothetical protein
MVDVMYGELGRNCLLSQSFSAVPGDVPQAKGYILQEPPYDELTWLGLYALKSSRLAFGLRE